MYRVATVKLTGEKYLVIGMDIPRNGPVKVKCWGNLQKYDASRSRRVATRVCCSDKTRVFFRDEVDITECRWLSLDLVEQLFEQTVKHEIEKGNTVRVRGNIATITVTVEHKITALQAEGIDVAGMSPVEISDLYSAI